MLGVPLALSVLALAPPQLLAQTEAHGEVAEVRGFRARIALHTERLPQIGDPVTLGEDVSGVGLVAIGGDWRVTEIDEDGGVWADPHDRAPQPRPGLSASVLIGGRDGAPRPGSGVRGEPRYAESFDGPGSGDGWPAQETEACRARPDTEGYRIAHTGAVRAPCRVPVAEAGRVGPGSRIAVTATLLAAEDYDEPYGFAIGMADPEAASYLLFVLSGDGRYVATRWLGDGAELLAPRLEHPSIAVGRGATNRLAIEIDGDRVHAFVNGVYLGAAEVAVPAGYMGLVSGFGSLDTVFDDLVVSSSTP